MTAAQLDEVMKGLGFGVNDLARMCDVDRRRAARWLSGEREVPGSLTALLAVMCVERLSVVDVMDDKAICGWAK